MIDYGLILRGFFALSLTVVAHEVGHYAVAKRYGWRPRFGLAWHRGPAFAVYTRGVSFTIETPKDFVKVYVQLATFGSMGTFASILAILAFQTIGLLPIGLAFLFTIAFALYGFSEVCDPSVDVMELNGG